RYYRIQAEQEALQANFVAAALHVTFAADRELFAEAREQYSYTVPLNGLALQWGLAAAVILFLLAELTTTCCAGCVRYVRNRRHSHQSTRHSRQEVK
ncbi:MAG: DUF2937 family protein, partial [Pseudomonadales bacterium]|nr:DUF2937 family protein [Pseudomonadales bacterium]